MGQAGIIFYGGYTMDFSWWLRGCGTHATLLWDKPVQGNRIQENLTVINGSQGYPEKSGPLSSARDFFFHLYAACGEFWLDFFSNGYQNGAVADCADVNALAVSDVRFVHMGVCRL